MHIFYSFLFASWLHLQLQSKIGFLHLHAVQSPLQEHLITSLHVLDISGIGIQTQAPRVVKWIL